MYLVKEVYPEPIGNCLHSVKLQITSILNDLDVSDYVCYMTGGNQFRETVGTIKPYKGNRDPLHKPFYYQEIKDYLLKYWNTKTIDYYEADDAMAMGQWSDYQASCPDDYHPDRDAAWRSETIICTIDKDLDQIPGWHYNFLRKEKYWVTEEDANKWFYLQLIAGDPTDNIPGVPKYGIKRAEKALSTKTTLKEYYETAKALYEEAYKDKAEAALIETARLVYMTRVEGEEWKPPM